MSRTLRSIVGTSVTLGGGIMLGIAYPGEEPSLGLLVLAGWLLVLIGGFINASALTRDKKNP